MNALLVMVDVITLVLTLMEATSVFVMMDMLYQVMAILALVIKVLYKLFCIDYAHTYSVDVNECDDGRDGGCEQVCFNTIGSYHCNCNTGYNLIDDYNCSGN